MTSTAMFAVISEVVQAVSNVYYESYNMMLFAEEFLACYWLAAGCFLEIFAARPMLLVIMLLLIILLI